MNAKRLLLTGGSGLLGRTLTPILRKRYDVTHFDMIDPGDGLPFINGSLCDAAAVEAACRGMDVIVHIAALHGQAWAKAGDHTGFEVNVMGTQNILEGARKSGAQRVVFTSSIWAAGHTPVPPAYLPIDENLPREPFEIYGLTKKLGEQMCRFASQRWGLSTICLRPGGICASDVPKERRFAHLGAMVDVRDVAQAHALAVAAPDTILHDTFIVTADTVLCRIDPVTFFADRAATLERLFPGIKAHIDSGKFDPNGITEWYSNDKAKRLLGYKPEFTFQWPATQG
ncbi:MAG: hypothetical protein A3K19_32535 [Lentisphaerae bacterium RIFOXYB12_FULL_65_16]|nr:MAG: hypothetical protein A3K18_08030 [Lentisphaerae bacterium RIFOXYA12_64_32]OGV84425.1 MAG: hypothetical protein A3K19_32535 [Lentisphaerae bacterium RIFOXYB12_FULL_65_16]